MKEYLATPAPGLFIDPKCRFDDLQNHRLCGFPTLYSADINHLEDRQALIVNHANCGDEYEDVNVSITKKLDRFFFSTICTPVRFRGR